jgi:hypothetical protein
MKCINMQVSESFITCLDEDRDPYLYALLSRHPGKAVVFVNAITSVRRLAALLKYLGLNIYPIHAQQQQRQRLKSLDRFKEDPQGVLVATDVAARGLDIPNVRTVLHYQVRRKRIEHIEVKGKNGINIKRALDRPRAFSRVARWLPFLSSLSFSNPRILLIFIIYCVIKPNRSPCPPIFTCTAAVARAAPGPRA